MRTDDGLDYGAAIKLLHRGRAKDALFIAERLVASSVESERLDGYMCLGAVYEDGGDDVAIDLSRAISAYRQAAVINPCGLTFMSLARVQMLSGLFPESFRSLGFALEYGESPELYLGFAQYYECNGAGELEKSAKFYRRAASTGRFAGFFGYSRVARLMGRKGVATLVDALRIVMGPFIFLLIGAKARYTF